jgi:hypothetical protein
MKHNYTAEHLAWMREHYPQMNRNELANAFNRRFNLDRPTKTIIACLKNHKIKSGRDGRFIQGMSPHNSGKKGIRLSQDTEFKKGRKPHNYLPVGSERINTYGYHDVKIADPNKWRAKHALMWEEMNGPIPRGHVVIFIDGDKDNIQHINFALVKRAELARLNKTGFSTQPKEFRETHIAIARLDVKTHELTRAKGKSQATEVRAARVENT